MKQIIKDNIISDFLNKEIINNKFVYLNNWSIIHFISGILLYFLTKSIIVLLILLLLYELFEFLFWGVLFKKETLQDIIWDLISAFIGFILIGLL